MLVVDMDLIKGQISELLAFETGAAERFLTQGAELMRV